MRSLKMMLIAAMILSLGGAAYAELQSAEVFGKIRIRGSWYDMDNNVEQSWVEQRTNLGVKADFTDEVSAVIEFDSYDVWGEDFRSDYVTGNDFRAASGDDVEVYQAYIEAREMWGTGLQLRVGRQELSLGSEWLVGVNDAAAGFWGLSFDAVRLDYVTDMFTVTALWAKLAENFGDFAENDADLYGIYGSYTGIEDMVIDAYWLYVREDESPAGFVAFVGGTDADLHTFGLRAAGEFGGFDYEAEVAYQTGEVERPRVFFWRDRDLDYDNFAANLEAGYTFDMAWTPRVFLGMAYLGGENGTDNDLSFNRLFSNWEYSEFIENTDLSNVFIYRAGVSVQPTEAIEVGLSGTWFEVDDEAPDTGWWFWKNEADTTVGIESSLWMAYQYSDDLSFNMGWAHFFGDDGLEDLNVGPWNGLATYGGNGDDDYDYLWIETEISF